MGPRDATSTDRRRHAKGGSEHGRTNDEIEQRRGRRPFASAQETDSRILIRGSALVALICAVTAASDLVAGRLPGDSIDTAWETPADDKATELGNWDWLTAGAYGGWLAGDTLVRSRHNTATGHDAGSGKQVWEYRPPSDSKICAAEADVDHSVIVVTHGSASDGRGGSEAKGELS
ncbi:hypothetical protein ABTY00_38420 [Streptomyces microflavus]|uniref:hypothetical protein n=1 Tax=Streptomyces microflavus TaxID=1919 RepID=UPI0033235C82